MHAKTFDVTQLSRNRKETCWIDVAPRSGGGMWRLPLLYVAGADAGPTLVVTAGVHGDEYEGIEAIPRVFGSLNPADLRGTLVMVTVCNVPAYEAAMRSSPIDGHNLARVFPGSADGTITERIAHVVTEQLLKSADFFIDLHSGGVAYNIPTLIGYVHDEGDLGRQSQAAADAFGAPVVWGHPLPMPPGRSISAATELGVPSLYTEAPGGGYAREDDVACFTEGVLNVMRHLDMLDGEPQPRERTHHLVGSGDLDSVLSTPAAGYFRAEVSVLDDVSAGQRLGSVQDFFGKTVAEIQADRDGVVIMLRRFHRVHAGDNVAHVTNYAS